MISWLQFCNKAHKGIGSDLDWGHSAPLCPGHKAITFVWPVSSRQGDHQAITAVRNTVWAFATVSQLDEQLVAELRRYMPQELANTAWSLATTTRLD